jgi:hypothetical protein
MIAYPFSKEVRITATYQDHLDRDPPSTAPGIDYAAPTHTPVLAPFAGIVRSSRLYELGGRGLWIEAHPELVEGPQDVHRVYYAHLSCLCCLAGENVQPGQTVAYTGNTGRSTGPHLHLSVKVNGEYTDPAPLLADPPTDPEPPTEDPLTTATWKLSLPADKSYVITEITGGLLKVTGTTPGLPTGDLQGAIRQAGYNHLGVPRNEAAALLKHARREGLGAPLTPEYAITFLGMEYICQGFALAIACCPKGQWDKVSAISW